MALAIIAAFLACSLCLNAFLAIKLLRKPKKTESLELREFLADLMAGPAMLAIARVDQDNILLRSPKNR